jgi:5-methylcytosine-specific restriction enzyme subunit McrC
LIDMLKTVGSFTIYAPSSSSLKLKSNSILDLYFELFLNEIDNIIRKGLIKRYRKTEGNLKALKGNIKFAKQIQQNLIHKERFFANYNIYDQEHIWHKVLYKGLMLLKNININPLLHTKICDLLFRFPEMEDIVVTVETFTKLAYNRKTEPYRSAIEIARLLLLNYHPDVCQGSNHVLALMFDMNTLWEKFVYMSIKKNLTEEYSVSPQSQKHFWQKDGSNSMKMIPDIVIQQRNTKTHYILDTKWKNLGDYNPSPEDLRQMYVYGRYHNNANAYLVYPGLYREPLIGKYFREDQNENHSTSHCGIITIAVNNNIKAWQKDICSNIMQWITFLNVDTKVNKTHNINL